MQRMLLSCSAFITSLLLCAQLDVPWTPLGGGTDQEVQVLLRLGNGDLLVAGQFTSVGNNVDNFALCNRVARWDGARYTAMPGFPEDFDITSAAELNDTIYIGGRPTAPFSYHDLMKWGGSTWTGETVYQSILRGVSSLFVHDNALYSSGGLNSIEGNRAIVRRHNGTNWEMVGQALNRSVLCFASFNGQLVCGGAFTNNYLSTANDIRYIAYLDGDTWTQLGDGLDGTVNDLLVHDNALYATGDMRSPTGVYFGLARITPEATAWEQLMPNSADYVRTPVSGMMAGQSMVEHNGVIHIGGEFLIATGSSLGRGLAVFGGAPDEVEAYGNLQGPVQAVELINDHELVIGGGASTYRNIASTNLLTNGIGDRPTRAAFTLAPNPVSDVVTLRLTDGVQQQLLVRVLDINGRLVRDARVVQVPSLSMDLSNEPAGTYIVEIRSAEEVHRERIVLMR